jgi:hypothetical protein
VTVWMPPEWVGGSDSPAAPPVAPPEEPPVPAPRAASEPEPPARGERQPYSWFSPPRASGAPPTGSVFSDTVSKSPSRRVYEPAPSRPDEGRRSGAGAGHGDAGGGTTDAGGQSGVAGSASAGSVPPLPRRVPQLPPPPFGVAVSPGGESLFQPPTRKARLYEPEPPPVVESPDIPRRPAAGGLIAGWNRPAPEEEPPPQAGGAFAAPPPQAGGTFAAPPPPPGPATRRAAELWNPRPSPGAPETPERPRRIPDTWDSTAAPPAGPPRGDATPWSVPTDQPPAAPRGDARTPTPWPVPTDPPPPGQPSGPGPAAAPGRADETGPRRMSDAWAAPAAAPDLPGEDEGSRRTPDAWDAPASPQGEGGEPSRAPRRPPDAWAGSTGSDRPHGEGGVGAGPGRVPDASAGSTGSDRPHGEGGMGAGPGRVPDAWAGQAGSDRPQGEGGGRGAGPARGVGELGPGDGGRVDPWDRPAAGGRSDDWDRVAGTTSPAGDDRPGAGGWETVLPPVAGAPRVQDRTEDRGAAGVDEATTFMSQWGPPPLRPTEEAAPGWAGPGAPSRAGAGRSADTPADLQRPADIPADRQRPAEAGDWPRSAGNPVDRGMAWSGPAAALPPVADAPQERVERAPTEPAADRWIADRLAEDRARTAAGIEPATSYPVGQPQPVEEGFAGYWVRDRPAKAESTAQRPAELTGPLGVGAWNREDPPRRPPAAGAAPPPGRPRPVRTGRRRRWRRAPAPRRRRRPWRRTGTRPPHAR